VLAQEKNAVTQILALVPFNVLVPKDGSQEMTTQVVVVNHALMNDAVSIRRATDMEDVWVVVGIMPPICPHACALLLLALMRNVVSLCATWLIPTFVEVANNLRCLRT